MNYVILDLEFNGSYSRRHKRFVNEIIEFGAVKVNSKLEVIDSFSMLIKPQLCKKLSNHITELTHITNEEIFSSNNSFGTVVNRFNKFVGNSVLITWGTTDILTLIDNFKYLLDSDKIKFLKYYCDLQDYCQRKVGFEVANAQLSLQSCADMLGIKNNQDEVHRAYTDALLSLECLKKLYNKADFKMSISKANSEFYKKVTFKTKTLTDLYNPLVDRRELYFNCDNCGHLATATSHFKLRNKCFFADYICPNCHKEFKGRITLKLKYEGVIVKKKIIEKPPEDEENSDKN